MKAAARPGRSGAAGARLLAPPTRAVLTDAAADTRLRRDGFVVHPLLTAAEAAELRECYGDLHGWAGTGFEVDVSNADLAYRSTASALLGERLDDRVARCFRGYEPYLRAFICKWPGAHSELNLHQDWMYIDESAGDRSYVVWIALQDVTGHEGQVQLVRNSHRLRSEPRGTMLTAPWVDAPSVSEGRLLTVPIRAGDALIMDNALLHCSLPNHTSTPRVAAAIGMRPAGLPLVHYRRVDEYSAARYDVDDEFFLTVTPAQLLDAPPDLAPAAFVPITHATAEQAVRSLGRNLRTRLDVARSRRRGRNA